MKELDVLFERFIQEEQKALEQGNWPELESLLALEDDQLWDFIQKPGSADARRFHDLLNKLCNGPVISH
jgi:succinate dehydrogenase flavin-adding protein (antitoxin of CptAB toxin-antitoxin module)